ncbi:MAG: 3-keto-disaccharide hydrolase, partial [Planctomycetota bacterium]
GFAPLFGKEGLKGWKVSDWSDLGTPQKVKGTPWKLEAGVLYGLNKRTWIMSPNRYGDFVLKLESKITRGSNGGIGLRFPPKGDPAYTAMEIQVVDHEVYYRGRSLPKQRTGSIYDEIAPSRDVVKPVGQWNSWEITALGSRIQIVLNSQKIIDVDLSRERKARQKKGPALAERPLKGHIGFQNLNGSITLRNIRIKKLGADAAGFVPLFNGRNLDGWVNVNCAPETWTVRDEMIICTGMPTGVLHYENYVLELEWRHMKKGGNAGLFIHSDPVTAPGQPFTRSIEMQIMDGNAGDMFSIHGATMRTDKPHPRGWMRSLPSEDRMNPTGQWNHYRIESRDGAATLAVNGKVVTRGYDLNPRKGYICLESEGSEIHFRNIRIKESPGSNPPPEMVAKKAEGFRSLYNGLDLRGWKNMPGHEGHWRAKNWVLDYDGRSEAKDKHLWTEQEFGNFTLIVDWRLPAEPKMEQVPVISPDGSQATDVNGKELTVIVRDGGDSGIYLRGSSKSQINIWSWPVGSGEIWGYRTDESMPADVRRAATPILKADNLVGRWNRFVITAVGDTVTVVLNGKTVIDMAKLPGIPAKGPIALQHHGDPIQFANIYIKELD